MKWNYVLGALLVTFSQLQITTHNSQNLLMFKMALHLPRLDGRKFRRSLPSTGHMWNYLLIWTSVFDAKVCRPTIYRMIFITYEYLFIYLWIQNNFAVKRRNLLFATNAFIIKSIFILNSINNIVFIAIPVAGWWWVSYLDACFRHLLR